MASYSKNSWLKSAPNKSFYTGLNYNNLPKFPNSINDKDFVLTEQYNLRPDLLSNELYGTVDFWWVFSLRNPDVLKDPINDFVAGVQIKVPSQDSVEKLARGT